MNYMRVISKYVHSAAYRVHVVLPQQGLKEVNTQHHANHAYIPPISCIKVNFFSNLTPQGRTRRFHSTFPPLWLTVELAVDSVQIKNLQFFGLEVTLLHLPITVVQHSHYCIFSRRFKLPFFLCLELLSRDTLQWKFNKGVNETGYAACLCRKAPWGCFTLEDSLYERPGSRPRGLSYTRLLWPQSHRAKCKSDNVDNCLLKIMDCWLRSMPFPKHRSGVNYNWMNSRLNCVRSPEQ